MTEKFPLIDRSRSPIFQAKSVKRRVSDYLKLGPTGGMRTNLGCQGKPVIFIHNPRTGGSSLEKLFGVKRLSHTYPTERLQKKHWLSNYVVSSVREPFERFLSAYYFMIWRNTKTNGLVKLYGKVVKSATPFDFLDIIRESPRFYGPQSLWTDYPCATKPQADLILRFENIQNWPKLIAEAGVNITPGDMPHENRSARAIGDHLDRLSITAKEFDRLQSEVYDHYASDYERFGYKLAA
ncbi:MAG: sulfotransferase family 2 domain-containing protein [Pseudomonadota bacterium]